MAAMSRSSRPSPRFELTGGALCLDFANTVGSRPDPARRSDRLADYEDLVAWSRLAGILTRREAERLRRAAAADPKLARAALARARRLRETIYRVFTAVASGRAPSEADLVRLQAVWNRAMAQSRLVWAGDQAVWRASPTATAAFDGPAWAAARAAVELLTSPRLSRVRTCAAPGCGWLFVDLSRNRSRRWCDMRVCGNRAKVRRFYARRRHASVARAAR